MSLDTKDYVYKLRFSIDKNAPPDYMKRWLDFKNKCEGGGGKNKHIVEHIKESCSFQENKNLPYLNRSEGGMGGNNNSINKQIRFREKMLLDMSCCLWQYDNDIVMDQIYSTETEKWTYEEMGDLLSAFIKVSEYYVKSEGCIRGWIEMTPQDIYRY
jgi:hypothetical protein